MKNNDLAKMLRGIGKNAGLNHQQKAALMEAAEKLEGAAEGRAQKPLTLEEACGSEEPCVYLEIHPNQHLKPSIQAVDVCFASDPEAAFDCEVHQIGRINPALLISTMYNKVWRCWATKPTDEERRAAGWDE